MKKLQAVSVETSEPMAFNDFSTAALNLVCHTIHMEIKAKEGGSERAKSLPLRLEALAVAAMFDECDWSSAWAQFFKQALANKGKLPMLGSLQLDLPPQLQYLLSDGQDDGAVSVKEEQAQEHSVDKFSGCNEQHNMT